MQNIVSRNGLLFLGAREALVLVSYPDGNDRWSIGFGHNNDPKYPAGSTIDIATGFVLLQRDTSTRGADINRWLKGASVTQAQFDMLLSLYYEYGNNNNTKPYDKTVWPLIQQICALVVKGNMARAGLMFLDCNLDPNNVPSHGLLTRRRAELNAFIFGDYGALGTVQLWRGNPHTTKPENYAVQLSDLP